MTISIINTPFKLTYQEILLSSAITIFLSKLQQNGIKDVDLEALCSNPQYGYTAPASNEPTETRFLRITDIKAGRVAWENVPFCICPDSERYEIVTDDILIARSGSVGKSFLVKDVPQKTVFASYMIRIRMNPDAECLPEYLYWCLQSQQFWHQVMGFRRGSAMKNINAQMLKSLAFPVPEIDMQQSIVNFLEVFSQRLEGDIIDLPNLPPPLIEQRRIVERIEALAGKVEEARRLREAAVGETKAIISSALHQIFEVESASWDQMPMTEAIQITAQQVDPTNPEYSHLPHINGSNIESKTCRLLPYNSVEQDGMTSNKYLFQPNTVLYSKIRPYLQKATYVDFTGLCSADMYPIEMKSKEIDPKFLMWSLVAGPFTEYANQLSGRTRMPKLNRKQLFGFFLAYPAISKQKQIVDYLEKLQQKLNSLHSLQEKTYLELNSILPSILDKAFKGEL
jgi:type I restriction enzyme, S subunit